jgi:hypothetical protein
MFAAYGAMWLCACAHMKHPLKLSVGCLRYRGLYPFWVPKLFSPFIRPMWKSGINCLELPIFPHKMKIELMQQDKDKGFFFYNQNENGGKLKKRFERVNSYKT